ncbi:MAG: hypothetical protein JWN29_1918 [Acidimicrobiales bacterium]|nr:hypothetical protein [Acidimicrobiales bacterium]
MSSGTGTLQGRSHLAGLEGRQVSVALRDGLRIDDCQLVSAGRSQVSSLWLFTDGVDTFVAIDDVIDIWEAAA